MKNMSKTAKFFVICAVIFTLGLVMTVGGCAAGGIAGIQEAVDGRLPSGTEAAETVMVESDHEFSSIEAKGDADLVIVGSKYYREAVDDIDFNGVEPKAGKVAVIYEPDKEAPEVKTEGDTLVIDAEKDSSVHFNDDFFEPTVIVFCDDKELESVKVDSVACDLEIKGVSFKNADLELDAGDIDLKDIISGGISIKTEAGDTEIAGVLRGLTEVTSDAGDVEIDVFDGTAHYTLDLKADAGDIKVGEDESSGSDYTQKGGEDTIRVKASAGDIEIGDL